MSDQKERPTQSAGDPADIPACVGLDVGTRRIGVAVNASSFAYAMPHQTVEARNWGDAATVIARIIKDRQADVVVVGWPLNMDGSAGRATRRVDSFLNHLRGAMGRADVDPDIIKWDERLTTTSAEANLIDADVSRAKRKQVIDQLAAAQILDGYLASQTH